MMKIVCFLFTCTIAQFEYAQDLVTFDEQGWDSNQSLDSDFTVGNFLFSGNKNFYTNYGFNFDVYSVSVYYAFQKPSEDKIIIRTLDNGPFNLKSFAIYQVSEIFSDTLVIEGWNDTNRKFEKEFTDFSKWEIMKLDYNNINKVIIKTRTMSNNGLADFNFDNFSFSSEVISEQKDNPKVTQDWTLSQNYPNPFNPSTVFTYQVPYRSYVTIKVYDVIGNEISTIVDEEKNAGSYSLTFNAINLPSGIYIYQLISNEYKLTKKMILIK
jgi:Secretion system C-terminal sorting domain